MAIFSKPIQYRAYMLRFWAEPKAESDGPVLVWRFSLEDPHTGRRQGFASLDELMAFLEAKTGKNPDLPDSNPPA